MLKKTGLTVAALLFCLGSLSCSVVLWVGEQQSIQGMLLAGAFAVALELCKFIFFPVAAHLRGIKSAGLYLMAFVLLLVSVVATVIFLETASVNGINESRMSSDVYMSAKRDVVNYENEITSILRVMENYSKKKNYGNAAASQSKRLDELRANKTVAIEALNTVPVQPERGIRSFFETIAGLLGANVDLVRQSFFVALALLVDVCGVICLVLLVSPVQQAETPPETILETKPVTMKRPSITSATPETQDNVFQDKPETVKQNIVSGKYGSKPVMRNIITTEKIRHSDLKRVFEALIAEGLLVKKGRSFQLREVDYEQI